MTRDPTFDSRRALRSPILTAVDEGGRLAAGHCPSWTRFSAPAAEGEGECECECACACAAAQRDALVWHVERFRNEPAFDMYPSSFVPSPRPILRACPSCPSDDYVFFLNPPFPLARRAHGRLVGWARGAEVHFDSTAVSTPDSRLDHRGRGTEYASKLQQGTTLPEPTARPPCHARPEAAARSLTIDLPSRPSDAAKVNLNVLSMQQFGSRPPMPIATSPRSHAGHKRLAPHVMTTVSHCVRTDWCGWTAPPPTGPQRPREARRQGGP